ncbi:hypothetical protein Tco_1360547 [Tanacetum coccineum]
METTMPHKEETFQVVIDLVKNSSCFKAFIISTDVPKILMQQFWYSIKKVQGTDYYEFLLANKKCVVNVDVFRTILDICSRVEGVNFTDVPDDDTTLVFLIKLCYKGGEGDGVLNWTSSGVIGERSIKDEEVSLVDGVLEGALGALEALEIEALVDAMDVDSG